MYFGIGDLYCSNHVERIDIQKHFLPSNHLIQINCHSQTHNNYNQFVFDIPFSITIKIVYQIALMTERLWKHIWLSITSDVRKTTTILLIASKAAILSKRVYVNTLWEILRKEKLVEFTVVAFLQFLDFILLG